MKPPRFRMTLGRMMIALAVGAVFEVVVARLAVEAAKDGGSRYEIGRAIWHGALLHVPAAFVGLMIWAAYGSGKDAETTDPADEGVRRIRS